MNATEEKIRKAVGATDGREFPAYAWPGGYPVLYLADDGETICAGCVNSEPEIHFEGDADGWRIDAYFVHYEGPNEFCANCGDATPSAYGDPDEFGTTVRRHVSRI